MNGIQHFSKMTTIDLHGNNLLGVIPEDIDLLVNLRVLIFNNNQLSGTIPESLGNLNMLAIVQLNNNHLDGSIPATWTNLTNLSRLDVEHNDLTGPLPDSFDQFVSLQNVDFRHNKFTGELPDISQMSKLKTFHLAHNNFSGNVPQSFGLNTTITDIDLHANTELEGVTDELFISNTNLKYLDVRHTNMTQIKPELETLKTINGDFFGYDLLNETETNLLDFVTQEILDVEITKVDKIKNYIAKEDFNVYVSKAQTMMTAKTAVHDLLLAPEYVSLNDNVSLSDYEQAVALNEAVVDGELKIQLSDKLTLVYNMIYARDNLLALIDEQNNLKDEISQNDISNVKSLIEKLHESETKQTLVLELNRIQKQYDEREHALKLVHDLFKDDVLIKDETVMANVLEAHEAVILLPDGTLKNTLLERVDSAKTQVEQREYTVVKPFEIYTGSELMEITLDGPAHLLTNILVNNEPLQRDYYSLRTGSTIVTLKHDYVSTLDNGDYMINFIYSNEEDVESSFTVNLKDVKPPKKGEESNPDNKTTVPTGIKNQTLLFGGVLVVALVVIILLGRRRKK